MATKKTKKLAPKLASVQVTNLPMAVKRELKTEPPLTVSIPADVAEKAGLGDGYEITVVTGFDDIKRFLAGAAVEATGDGTSTYREGDFAVGAILLTF